MRLAVRREAFHHPDWIWELKYDGFRALARIDGGRAELISRRGNVYKCFAPLCADLARALAGREALLDGEIVYLDAQGRPQFYELLRRRGDPCFYAFDLLWLDGRDLHDRPLVERIMPAAGSRLMYARHLEADGTGLFELVCREDLEGVLGKWARGAYVDGGRRGATSWIKVKNLSYSQAEGRSELFERRASSAAG